MNARNFIKEMQSVIDKFEERAKEYGTINESGIEICFVNGYAVLQAEVDDENGDTIVCDQEVEFWDEDAAPVKPLYFTATTY